MDTQNEKQRGEFFAGAMPLELAIEQFEDNGIFEVLNKFQWDEEDVKDLFAHRENLLKFAVVAKELYDGIS